MTGAGKALWAIPGGVLLPTREGIACISDTGSAAFETKIASGPAELCASGEGVVVLASRNALVALDPADGRPLWKRRLPSPALAVAVAPGRILALCAERRSAGRLAAFAPQGGKLLWARPIAGTPDPALFVALECAVAVSNGKVLAARLSDGTLRFEAKVPFPGEARLACAEDDDPRRATLLLTAAGGACARIGERGSIVWSVEPEGNAPPAPALLARGVALVVRGAADLLDAQEGLALTRIGSGPPHRAALGEDASVALCDASGAVSLHRLATHLSVVTT